jgi:glycerol-3-phosphate cytidylyltransferase
MTTVLTYGVFDSLTPESMDLLRTAKGYGDNLIVGLATDAFVAENNLITEYDYLTRRQMVLNTVWTDTVVPLSNVNQVVEDIDRLRVDVLVVTEDWQGSTDDLTEKVSVIKLPVHLVPTPAVSAPAADGFLMTQPDLADLKRMLMNGMFRYAEVGNEDVKAQRVALRGDGRLSIEGDDVVSNSFWRFDVNALIFETPDVRSTTTFDLHQFNPAEGGLLSLRGVLRQGERQADYVLTELSANERDSALMASELATIGLREETFTNMQSRVDGLLLRTNPYANKVVHSMARVLFILNDDRTLLSLMELIIKSAESSQLEVKVFVTSRFENGVSVGNANLLGDILRRANLPVLRSTGNEYDDLERIKAWDPDYIFRQSLADDTYHEAFRYLALSWTKLAYVPTEITNNVVQHEGLFSPDLQQTIEKLWRLFVALPLTFEEEQSVRESLLTEESVVVVGSAKAMAIRDAQPNWPVPDQRYKILWVADSSVGDAGDRFGNFDRIARKILRVASANEFTSFVFSPSPDLRETIRRAGEDVQMTLADYDNWLLEWEALPNTAIIDGTNVYPAMAAADIVLTDGGLGLYEAQILQRPVIFFEREDHEPFTVLGLSWAEGVHKVSTMSEFAVQLNKLLTTPDELLPKQRENMAVLMDNQFPVEMIIQDILNDWEADNK